MSVPDQTSDSKSPDEGKKAPWRVMTGEFIRRTNCAYDDLDRKKPWKVKTARFVSSANRYGDHVDMSDPYAGMRDLIAQNNAAGRSQSDRFFWSSEEFIKDKGTFSVAMDDDGEFKIMPENK